MTVPFYTSVREYHNRKEEFDKAISAVLEKGDFILGGVEKDLEQEIASYGDLESLSPVLVNSLIDKIYLYSGMKMNIIWKNN